MEVPRPWRRQELVVDSAMSAADAVQALAADVRPWSPFSANWKVSLHDTVLLSGHACEGDVRVRALRPFQRNSWSPVLSGRVVPHSDGCRFEGTIGLDTFVIVFSIFWVGIVSLFLVAGLAIAVGSLLSHHPTAALQGLAFVVVPTLMLVSFVGITSFATRSAQPQATYLVDWVRRRLET